MQFTKGTLSLFDEPHLNTLGMEHVLANTWEYSGFFHLVTTNWAQSVHVFSRSARLKCLFHNSISILVKFSISIVCFSVSKQGRHLIVIIIISICGLLIQIFVWNSLIIDILSEASLGTPLAQTVDTSTEQNYHYESNYVHNIYDCEHKQGSVQGLVIWAFILHDFSEI